jgi:enediyne biosynthesis protein E4
MNSPTKIAATQLRWPRSLSITAGLALLATAPGASDAPPAAPFTRITTGAVWNELLQSVVAAWGDYDHDGWLDLFIGNRGVRNSLFRNNGDGTFTKITSGPVVTDVMDTHSAAWLDYNNDGALDLAVIDLAGKGNHLYRNIGGGAFARVTAAEVGSFVSNLANSVSISVADYDRDGLPDLFVANGALFANQKDFLYHNQGEGHFLRIENSPITTPELSTTQGTWADYDGDGDPDLFVTHSQDHGNSLFRNDGGGQFTEVTQASGLGDFGDSVGSAWGDYDNDGDLDLFVTNLRLTGPSTRNFLYRNEGNGTFTKITEGPIVTDTGHFQSGAWIDYDNDGWLDLFVSAHPASGASATTATNRLYRNLGGGMFVRVTAGNLVTDSGYAGGAAFGDFDNDGFPDVAVANGTIVTPQRNGLYRNNGNTNAWIKLKCAGTISNRFAIGTKVHVEAIIGGRKQSQFRQIVGTEGWLTFNALDVLVGLGDATVIDSIRIEWPSGMSSELRNVAPRQTLTITEGAALTMTRVDNRTFDLTWPAGDHVLESTADLSLPNWQPVPGVTGTTHRVTADNRQFFRLHHP